MMSTVFFTLLSPEQKTICILLRLKNNKVTECTVMKGCMMIYKKILNKAIELIGGARNTDYGDRVTNHQNIANLWSAFLNKKISAHDVAICMALVKVARLMHSRKSDSYVDLAAYGAIAGEIAEREEDKND
jgi:hypothetical protein